MAVPPREVLDALLRHKAASVTELASRLKVSRQHAHRLLSGDRSAESRQDDLDRLLALGVEGEDSPVYAIAELTEAQELELIHAGHTQPLFSQRSAAVDALATLVAEHGAKRVCVVPVWPAYAWRQLVRVHASWGVEADPRSLFYVDQILDEAIVGEIVSGMADTLALRRAGSEAGLEHELSARLEVERRYTAPAVPR